MAILAKRSITVAVGVLWLLTADTASAHQNHGKQRGASVTGKTIETVLADHTPRLMAMPGVVGTAQGLCAGAPCIKVYVDAKTADLARRIGTSLEGYPVEIVETGEIKALDSDAP